MFAYEQIYMTVCYGKVVYSYSCFQLGLQTIAD